MLDVQKNPAVEIVEVFADPTVEKASLVDGKLFLPVEDDYALLSDKTYAMMRFFSERGGFDYLVKIDDSIVDNPQVHALRRRGLLRVCKGDYHGIRTFISSPLTLKIWAKMHRITVSENFPLGFPYYSGKCYACSARACETVVVKGKDALRRFTNDFGGVEDAFVGYVLDKHFLRLRERLRLRFLGAMSFLEKGTRYACRSLWTYVRG